MLLPRCNPVQSIGDFTLFSRIYFSNSLRTEYEYHLNQAEVTHHPVRGVPCPIKAELGDSLLGSCHPSPTLTPLIALLLLSPVCGLVWGT